MKFIPAVFVLGVLMTLSMKVAWADMAVSKSETLQAIEVFQKDPSSREGLTAAAKFTSFAEKSDFVRVSLSKSVVPWLKGRDAEDADTRNMLLAAYIAGNVLAQLTNGKPEDDPYAGWKQVLATYAQLQHINPTVKFPEVDDLKAKEASGTLRSYAAEVLAKENAKEAGAKSSGH